MKIFLTKFSTNRNIVLLFVLFLGFNLWILPSMMPGEKPLDLEVFYTSDEAYAKVDGFSPEIRQSYRLGLMVSDMLYPLVYGALFSFVIFRLWSKINLATLPLFILLFDITENLSIINLLILYPEKSLFWGSLAGISTAIKWSFTAVTILMVLLGVGKKCWSKNKFA
jgi:hypothetical protein